METGLTMIFHENLPLRFWVDALLTATYLINNLISSSLNMDTPYLKMFGRHPNSRILKVLGCKCFPYLRNHNQNKFSKRIFPCVFIGYNPLHKGYRCIDPLTNKVYISTHVVFDEQIFLYSQKVSSGDDIPQLTVTTFPSQEEWFTKPSYNHSHPNLVDKNIEVVNLGVSQIDCCNKLDDNPQLIQVVTILVITILMAHIMNTLKIITTIFLKNYKVTHL